MHARRHPPLQGPGADAGAVGSAPVRCGECWSGFRGYGTVPGDRDMRSKMGAVEVCTGEVGAVEEPGSRRPWGTEEGQCAQFPQSLPDSHVDKLVRAMEQELAHARLRA